GYQQGPRGRASPAPRLARPATPAFPTACAPRSHSPRTPNPPADARSPPGPAPGAGRAPDTPASDRPRNTGANPRTAALRGRRSVRGGREPPQVLVSQIAHQDLETGH